MKKQLQQLWDFQSAYNSTRNTKPNLTKYLADDGQLEIPFNETN